MREIALDTETTGKFPEEGHRIVEIGAVELNNHLPTGRAFHQYVNPRRSMPLEAYRIHGLGADLLDQGSGAGKNPPDNPGHTLKDKPEFSEIAGAFLEFVGDARLVIHNARFDLGFLNMELKRADFPALPTDESRIVDTMLLAQRKYPANQVSLDALCRFFDIDNSARTSHGAILDAELLANVYLELIGGRQLNLDFGFDADSTVTSDQTASQWAPKPRPVALPPRITEEERQAHLEFVTRLGDDAMWLRWMRPS